MTRNRPDRVTIGVGASLLSVHNGLQFASRAPSRRRNRVVVAGKGKDYRLLGRLGGLDRVALDMLAISLKGRRMCCSAYK